MTDRKKPPPEQFTGTTISKMASTPEPADFDQIARELVDSYDPEAMGDRSISIFIAEALRQVWNTRGAADLKAAKEASNDRHGAPYPDLDSIIEEIGKLDR